MSSTDIDRMLAEKGNPCVSIIIPTFRYTRERMQNPERIEKAILKARALLTHSAWPRDNVSQVQARLDSLIDNIDYMRLQEGLAIFISPNIFRIHLLPFPVKEKVMLGRTFEIRDLAYFDQFLHPYYLLTISRKRVRLFKGSGRDLQEVVNNDFPKKYTEEYEYERPSIGSSSSAGLKSFERDKSVLTDTRTKAFFRNADDTLKKYVKGDMRLFIAGVEEEIADFEHISRHSRYIAGRIPGNYDVDAIHPLAEIAWKKIGEDIRRSNLELLGRLDDAIGKQLAVDGIANVWRAAKEGNGLMLLVEKDYQKRAYILPDNENHLLLTPPIEEHEIIHDAADDLIEIIKEKGGDVVVFENGELDEFHRMALLLRYSCSSISLLPNAYR